MVELLWRVQVSWDRRSAGGGSGGKRACLLIDSSFLKGAKRRLKLRF
jgi:hypothetical protein